MTKEQECIEKLLCVKITIAKAKLAKLQREKTPFLFIAQHWNVYKKKCELKKEIIELETVQINKNYTALQYDIRKDKRFLNTLSFLGLKFNKDIFTSDIPQDNTLWSLWKLYGLDKAFSLDERIGLVRDWIDTLCGKGVADKLDIESRVKKTVARNAEVSKSFHENNNGWHHNCVLFMNPVDSVIRDLSEELQDYQ